MTEQPKRKIPRMEMEDFEKHKNFLLNYALKNNIVFRVSRKGVSVGMWERPTFD